MRRFKVLNIMYICMVLVCMSGCRNTKDMTEMEDSIMSTTENTKEEQYEIALVADLGTIDDRSFNRAAWEGIKQYTEKKDVSYQYYQPQEGTVDAYVEAIDLAIEGGAKLVVCPGYLFETPVFISQDKYPEVNFVLIDGKPHNAAYNESRIEKNVLSILFEEEQAGFLAGYAAVKDGYTKLGFMGGLAVPAVIRYGYGFVQGCDYAAEELGIETEVIYTYTGSFSASPETEALAASWYEQGIEVIFACGGAVGNSVMAAAENGKNAKVIGVDVDQSGASETVISSAMKMITWVVYSAIEDYYADSFKGGRTLRYTAKNSGIGLPMETSKFNKFTLIEYKAIYEKLVSDQIQIENEVDDSTTADLMLKATKVKYIR